MKNQVAKYIAILSGKESIEFYLDKLSLTSIFDFSSTKKGNKILVRIVGPYKSSQNEDISEIHEKLSDHAHELGIKAPKLVNKVANKINYAQKAENLVLAEEMLLEATANVKADLVNITLQVVLDGNPIVDKCIDEFAFLRISELASCLNMDFESFKKS